VGGREKTESVEERDIYIYRAGRRERDKATPLLISTQKLLDCQHICCLSV